MVPHCRNWQIRGGTWYCAYEGVRGLMPITQALSSKAYVFDFRGRETTEDYTKLMSIVLYAGYRGHVGIEYEGDGLSERAGIRATKQLLMNVRDQLESEYT